MTKHNFYSLFSLLLSGLITACTGGGEQVNGSGQEADPVVVDFPIAYIKRPLPVNLDGEGNSTPVFENLREPIDFNPGAALFIRDRATPSALEVNITSQAFEADALYDVKDVEVSYDGQKLVFAMRAPQIEDLDESEQPTWNIWEYDNLSQILRRIITSDITAEAGHDVAPHYLPNGKIVFSSTRQRLSKAILIDEGKPQFAALDEDRNVESLNLHVMNDDGTEINQITFNQSHDLDPTVLSNGKVVFSRWDNYFRNAINLYQVNPDGSDLEILYGMESHETGSDDSTIEFMSPRQTHDGRLLVALKPATSFRLGGEFAFVDWENFVDVNQQTAQANTTESEGQVSATPLEVRTDDELSLGGRYSDIYPLYDGSGRQLMSWSPCRLDSIDAQDNPIIVACLGDVLEQENVTEAQPLYGIWIYDPITDTRQPVILGEEGLVTHEVVAMAPRTLPTIIPNVADSANEELLLENVGVVHIRSVYDFDGVDESPNGIGELSDPLQSNASDRPIRFIRIVKAVSLPDDELVDLNGTAFGRSSAQLMKEIIGYAVVEPDGSAKFKVPANIAFAISLLDAEGQRVSGRHQNWISVKAGEEKQCLGCHTRDSQLPHGRFDAQAESINLGAIGSGLPFPNANPELVAEQGETMAETYSRINGIQSLSVDLKFSDVWTDTSLREADPAINDLYSNLITPSPTSNACINQWNAACRIVINYPDIVQPIWDLDRKQFDEVGNLIQDNTCVSCHSQTDNLGQLQVPVAQLELVGTVSTDQPDHLTSYRELMFGDNEQEIVDGVLIDRLVQATGSNGELLFEVDEDGNLILDEDGNPIPVMVTVGVSPALNVNSALSNTRLFSLFEASGSHQGWLSSDELKLIAEWLDIGGQYYNSPFDVPQ